MAMGERVSEVLRLRRHLREDRQARDAVRLRGALHGGIEAVTDECEADADEQAEEEAGAEDQDVLGLLRRRRRLRRLGDRQIDDARLVEGAAEARFLFL